MGSRRGSGNHQGARDARIGRQKSGAQPTRVIVAAGVTRSSRIRLIAPGWTLWVGFQRPSTTHGFARSAER